MSTPWLVIWEVTLTTAVILSTCITIFILTLPTTYSHFHPECLSEGDFSEPDREDSSGSGYEYFRTRKDEIGQFRTTTSVQVVVLGDIGRSPRMQYHTLSLAAHGASVQMIGYVDSEIHPDILASRFVSIVPIKHFPKYLQTDSKLLFLLTAPLKVLHQTWTLYYTLAYQTRATRFMLVQNPPSIPLLAVAAFVCFFRNTRLVIDWHNFGYSILALRLGFDHPLVKISEWYESVLSRRADAHFAVTNAMTKALKTRFAISALTLHDRPTEHFRTFTKESRTAFLRQCEATSDLGGDLESGVRRLIVSSTSWTADEDFGLLLKALVGYSVAKVENASLPKVLVVITGKGPQKAEYIRQIQRLEAEGKLKDVVVRTAWLSTEDYAALLATADLGVSLHTSSSGVDLPMKVVDMFGAGLPVAGWSKYEAWPELVREGENGCGFGSPEELQSILEGLFSGDGSKLRQLKDGALKEGQRRWKDEWDPVAGRLFKLES